MSEYIVDFKNAERVSHFESLFADFTAPIHEEIVRCRDCKHFTPKGTHKFENGETNADYCKYVRGWMLQITPDGYCKWGERREGC